MSHRPFTRISAVAAPLIRSNVDTDAIIPSREVTGVTKLGLSAGLFAGWRYIDSKAREPDPNFVLNDPAYAGAQILLGGVNFGCGSSREHAVWALAEYGFRVVIAPSFGPIFQNNCVRNGLLPVCAPEAWIAALVAQVAQDPQRRRVSVDLVARLVVAPDKTELGFQIGDDVRDDLISGSDIIDKTLQHIAVIDAFRASDARRRPWAYL